MKSISVPPDILREAIEECLQQLHRDFNLTIKYSCENRVPVGTGMDVHLDFYAAPGMSREQGERLVEEATVMFERWISNFEASLMREQ